MADKFSDLFGDDSPIPKSLSASVDALDDAMAKFDALEAPLKQLKDQIDSNVKSLVKQAQEGKRSSKATTAAVKAQLKLLDDLNDSYKELTEGTVVGAEEMKAMFEAVTESHEALESHTDAVYADAKVIEERMKVEESLQAAIEKQEEIREAAAKAEEKRQERLAQLMREVNSQYEEAASGLSNLGDTLDDANVDLRQWGAAVVSGTARMRAQAAMRLKLRNEEGGLTKRGRRGLLAGGLLAGFIGLMMKTADRQRKALGVAARREFQYGRTATLTPGRVAAEKGMNRVRQSARKFAQDVEEAQAAYGQLVAETGEGYVGAAKAIDEMNRLAIAGLGSTGELTTQLIEMTNTLGISAPEAAARMEAVALQAQALNREMGGDGAAVQMDDFFKATNRLAEGMDGLSVSHKGLAKSMATTLKVGAKLDLSYNRRIKAAEGLTRALTQSYDEGFATMHVQEDLAAALESAEFGKEAAQIQDMLARGVIHAGQAARMLQETGAATDAGVFQARLERSALALVQGNAALVESQLGQLSTDQLRILEDVGQMLQQPGATIESVMSSIRKEDRTALRQMQSEAGRQMGLTATSLASATLDDLMTSLSGTFQTTLNLVVDALTGIQMSIEWGKNAWGRFEKFLQTIGKAPIFQPDGMLGALGIDEIFGTEAYKAKKEATETDIKIGKGRMAFRMKKLIGKGTTLEDLQKGEGAAAIEMLAGDKTLQQKFKKEYGELTDKRFLAAVVDVLGEDRGSKLISALKVKQGVAGGPETFTPHQKLNGDLLLKNNAKTNNGNATTRKASKDSRGRQGKR